MNRKKRKLKYIRTKNAYRILKLSYISENSITTNTGTFPFTFDDIAGHKGKMIIFTKEFYKKIV